MKEMILLFVSAALVNNVILARFLGLCSFMGVTTRISTAVGMGVACTFVITVSAMGDWAIEKYLLIPYGLGYLRTVTFILVIAAAVQFTEAVVRKVSPPLFEMLGIYLPLITTNCAVLGVALFQTAREYDFIQSVTFSIGGGLGFTLALVLMASVRERLTLSNVPDLAQGTALSLMLAGILSLSFMGFAGLGG
jgi:electron transport complex protein RnfA